MTVWREARRVKQEMLTDLSCETQPEVLEIIKAAGSGDWLEFTNLMGGAIYPRNERPKRGTITGQTITGQA